MRVLVSRQGARQDASDCGKLPQYTLADLSESAGNDMLTNGSFPTRKQKAVPINQVNRLATGGGNDDCSRLTERTTK